MNLPESVTKTLYILVRTAKYANNEIVIFDFDASKSSIGEYVLIQKCEFTTEIDKNIDLKNIIVQNLTAKLDKMKADHYIAQKEVEDEIRNLLALEDK